MFRMAAVVAAALLLSGCVESSPPPAGLTDDDRVHFALQEQDLQWFLAELPGERPIVSSSFVTTEDYGSVLTACFADQALRGVRVVHDAVVLPAAPLTPEQRLSLYLCSATYVIWPDEVGYLSREELERVYDYYRDWLVPCMEAHGLQVPLSVSKSAFAATPGYVDWTPYYTLEQQVAPGALSVVQSECPFVPPGIY